MAPAKNLRFATLKFDQEKPGIRKPGMWGRFLFSALRFPARPPQREETNLSILSRHWEPGADETFPSFSELQAFPCSYSSGRPLPEILPPPHHRRGFFAKSASRERPAFGSFKQD